MPYKLHVGDGVGMAHDQSVGQNSLSDIGIRLNGAAHQRGSMHRFGHNIEQVLRRILAQVEEFSDTAGEVFHGFAGRAACGRKRGKV